MNIRVFAPAKINLALEILGALENGYHEVDMVMQSIDLCDEIIIDDAPNNIIVECNKNLGCKLENNLAYKAAKNFFEYTSLKNIGIKISIIKNIPQEAGLAGGSSDAAAVLYALNSFFDAKVSEQELLKLGCEIGSDVPFCLKGGCLHATGIGTNLHPVTSLKNCFLVVVKPKISICTKEAYALCDSHKSLKLKSTKNLIKCLKNQNIQGVAENIFNRFEEVLNNIEILNIKESLCLNGALGACMSGSGSAVFGIFEDKNKAIECIKKLKKIYNQTFLCKPLDHGVYFSN